MGGGFSPGSPGEGQAPVFLKSPALVLEGPSLRGQWGASRGAFALLPGLRIHLPLEEPGVWGLPEGRGKGHRTREVRGMEEAGPCSVHPEGRRSRWAPVATKSGSPLVALGSSRVSW